MGRTARYAATNVSGRLIIITLSKVEK